MRALGAALLAAVWAGTAAAAENPPPPQFPAIPGCGTIQYTPAKIRVCHNARCVWKDPEPSQAYLFTDPIVCTGTGCPPGTLDGRGKMRM